MHEFDRGLESSVRQRRAEQSGKGWPFPGRHESHAEIEDETPIFHALTVGGWRDRQGDGASGRGVRRVHRGTIRTGRRRESGTAEAVASFHTSRSERGVRAEAARELAARGGVDTACDLRVDAGTPVPAPAESVESAVGRSWAEPGDAAMAMLRRRRDAERAADRAAVADLLGGAGRHRLTRTA